MEAADLGVSIQLGRFNIAAERRQTSLDRLSPQTSSWYPEAKNSKATNTSHPLYVPCYNLCHLLRSCSNRMDFCMEEGHLPPFCQALAQQVLNLGNRRHEAVTKKLSRAKTPLSEHVTIGACTYTIHPGDFFSASLIIPIIILVKAQHAASQDCNQKLTKLWVQMVVSQNRGTPI